VLFRDGITFSLDTPEPVPVSYSDYILSGWAFAKNASDRLEVVASVGGIEYPAFFGFSRPDVARHFKDQTIANCGFVIRFSPGKKPAGIAVFARLNGKKISLVDSVEFAEEAEFAADGRWEASGYHQWIKFHEPQLFVPKDEVFRYLSGLSYRPLISIILPTYNTPQYFLNRCLDSVIEQHYWNWQLCITDDNSSQPHVASTIQKYAASDPRILFTRRAEQGGISVASNEAIKQAQGDFIVLLDHDDELHPSALMEVARALNERNSYQLIYSDEDKISRFGERSQPAFKPDFDRNIFLTFNYLGHLVALKRSVAQEIGGFRPECDGAQDWDLLIRATEVIPPDAIGHIRKPLYHWRMHDNSTAFNLDAKPYAAKAWRRVLEDHARRTAQSFTVVPGLFYGSMRIKYPGPKQVEATVFLRPEDGVFQSAIVKMNAAGRDLHLYQLTGCEASELDAQDEVKVSLSDLAGDVFIFINGPLESLNHLFFDEIIGQAMRSDCGLVTGMAVDTENRILPTAYLRVDEESVTDPNAGVKIPDHGYMGMASVVRTIDACSELFFAVRRERLAEAGGMGAVSSFQMQALADLLCRKAHEKGLSILYTPYAVASFSSASVPRTRTDRNGDRSAPVRLNPHLLTFNYQSPQETEDTEETAPRSAKKKTASVPVRAAVRRRTQSEALLTR